MSDGSLGEIGQIGVRRRADREQGYPEGRDERRAEDAADNEEHDAQQVEAFRVDPELQITGQKDEEVTTGDEAADSQGKPLGKDSQQGAQDAGKKPNGGRQPGRLRREILRRQIGTQEETGGGYEQPEQLPAEDQRRQPQQ